MMDKMIKPKRIRKKKEILEAIYLDYKDLQYLKSNSCIGVSKSYFYRLVNIAMTKKLEDKHFWNIINKYELYDKYIYKNKPFYKYSNYHIMSLRDIYYLIHTTQFKPYSITTFIKTNVIEEELVEKHNKLFEEKALTLVKKITNK